MSYKLVDQVIATDVGDVTAKLVLILIARHAKDDGTGCIAGQETLAKLAGCTTRTVFKAMLDLTRAGLIRRRRRAREDGTRTSDETLIAVDTTGKIFRWSQADYRKKTASTTGRIFRAEAVRGIYKRNRSERERPSRRTQAAALDQAGRVLSLCSIGKRFGTATPVPPGSGSGEARPHPRAGRDLTRAMETRPRGQGHRPRRLDR